MAEASQEFIESVKLDIRMGVKAELQLEKNLLNALMTTSPNSKKAFTQDYMGAINLDDVTTGMENEGLLGERSDGCLLYTSPSPRD